MLCGVKSELLALGRRVQFPFGEVDSSGFQPSRGAVDPYGVELGVRAALWGLRLVTWRSLPLFLPRQDSQHDTFRASFKKLKSFGSSTPFGLIKKKILSKPTRCICLHSSASRARKL